MLNNQIHKKWMRYAYLEAMKAYDQKEIPVGAVVVYENKIIGKGYNLVETLNDATAHAEIIAITSASEYMRDWRLENCLLYVTLEPCIMCTGAIINSRIKKVIYGVGDNKAGGCDSLYHLGEDGRLNHNFELLSGVMEDEIRELMDGFFREMRKS
ncbi:MAG: tRNA adenosine(34) deaminase TadA [Candidatus Marinimicrobia bacterium]|nr:tRNA adenosine(34) deaminase TadA [Candidatus Neomarinimicrobiota bacterium]